MAASKLELSDIPASAFDNCKHGGIILVASGLTPLFMDTAANRAMFAAPSITGHTPKLTIQEVESGSYVVEIPLFGNLNLSVSKLSAHVTQKDNAPLNPEKKSDDQRFLDFSYITDLEKLYGTTTIKDFSGCPIYLYLNDGEFSTYAVRAKPAQFYVAGQDGSTIPVAEKYPVAERIAVQICFDEGKGATLTYFVLGEKGVESRSFDFKSGKRYTIHLCNLCEETVAENDFELLYWSPKNPGGIVRTTAAIRPILAKNPERSSPEPRLAAFCVPAFFGRTISF